ncbi:MAG: desulfoferrodoxin [Clostridia bacterium]|nr:desulfoferrodoxin [Clostridia bacterium]
MKAKFYICRHCGNLVGMINDAGVPMVCCGEKMQALVPNTVEASGEKHLPVVQVEDGVVNVNVGAVNHPMVDEHYIEWIYVQTENGGQRKGLKPGDEPKASFRLGSEKAVAVYAYCNLHGLWMTEV